MHCVQRAEAWSLPPPGEAAPKRCGSAQRAFFVADCLLPGLCKAAGKIDSRRFAAAVSASENHWAGDSRKAGRCIARGATRQTPADNAWAFLAAPKPAARKYVPEIPTPPMPFSDPAAPNTGPAPEGSHAPAARQGSNGKLPHPFVQINCPAHGIPLPPSRKPAEIHPEKENGTKSFCRN